jgi:hypothetical protein
MDDQVPIACSLTGAEMSGRLADMAELGRKSLIGVDDASAEPVVRFRDDTETRQRLETIVAAEAQCCAFLDLDLQQGLDGLELTLRGPEAAAPIVRDLVAAFRGDATA